MSEVYKILMKYTVQIDGFAPLKSRETINGSDIIYSLKSATLSPIDSGPVISLKGDMNTAMVMWPDIWDGVKL